MSVYIKTSRTSEFNFKMTTLSSSLSCSAQVDITRQWAQTFTPSCKFTRVPPLHWSSSSGRLCKFVQTPIQRWLTEGPNSEKILHQRQPIKQQTTSFNICQAHSGVRLLHLNLSFRQKSTASYCASDRESRVLTERMEMADWLMSHICPSCWSRRCGRFEEGSRSFSSGLRAGWGQRDEHGVIKSLELGRQAANIRTEGETHLSVWIELGWD